MRSDQARANNLKGLKLQEVLMDSAGDTNAPDMGGGYNPFDSSNSADLDGAQSSGGASGISTNSVKNKRKAESGRGFTKLKSTFTRQLLPSEVCIYFG